ncbi:MAG: hypothetical protein COA79_25260 [Planctomycetota bacterium]|nr:MAG: hypothetical protein COA79_25260 [Planctomycetota bacterium]
MAAYDGQRITFVEQGKVEILPFPQEKPSAGQVMVQNVASLVSAGTELSRLYDYHMVSKPFPLNTGYLSCVKVIELGEGVEDIELGKLYVASMGHLSHLAISPEKLLEVPEGVKPEDAVFTSLATISLRAIRQAEIKVGDSVLIKGLGLIGQFAQIFARLEGGVPVVAIDFSQNRRDIAQNTGLKNALTPSDNEQEEFKAYTKDGRFDVTIDSTGVSNVFASLPELTADFGRVIILGGIHNKLELDLYTHIQKRSLRLIGAGSPDPRNWPYGENENKNTVLKLMQSGQLNVSALRTHHVGLNEAPEMYRMLHEEKDTGLGVVFKW